MTNTLTEIFTHQQQEARWGLFLLDMPASDFHRLCKHELELHDRWIEGEISLLDILAVVVKGDDVTTLLAPRV